MVASDPVTTADVLIPLGAALLGAAFGGGASAVGSRWVHRGEITRQQRIRMYDELLPPVLLQTEANRQLLSGERPWTVEPVPAIELNALLRAAKIAGKRDAECATRIVTGGLSFQMQLIDFRRLPTGERDPVGSVIGMSDEQRVQLPPLRETHEALRGEISRSPTGYPAASRVSRSWPARSAACWSHSRIRVRPAGRSNHHVAARSPAGRRGHPTGRRQRDRSRRTRRRAAGVAWQAACPRTRRRMFVRIGLLAADVEHDVSGHPWMWIQTARDWLSVAMSLAIFGLLIGGCVAVMIFDSSAPSPAEPGDFDCARFPGEAAYNACVDDFAERYLPQ